MDASLSFSSLGFGCASLWASRLVPETQALALIQQAIEGGINYFDTGASYGCGLGETRLGKAISEHPREQLIISTKAGTLCKGWGKKRKDFSAAAVYDSLQRSLQRLQQDYVDILYLHGPEANDITDTLLHKLEDIKSEGLARTIGINSFNPDFVKLAVEQYPIFSVYMIEYNVYNAHNLPLAEWLKEQGKYVVAGAALGRAIYTNNHYHIYRPKNLWYWLRSLKSDHSYNKAAVDLHQTNQTSLSPIQKALQYVTTTNCIDSAVFNTTSTQHLHENLAALIHSD
ncbi:aldo/keto reductase [Marinicella sp. W31]|uniref:aldo/keto reductase n=1 Tax=Marinicella sp. W31 TaxID=3023713 RepID=UPI003756DAE1